MSILDTLLDVATNQVANNGHPSMSNNPLLESVIGLINNQQSGGLTGLVEAMTKGGLGEQVSSWVGTGQNLPASAEQIQMALGSPLVQSIATQIGLDQDNVANNLASLLPQVIDLLTPEGKVANDGNLQQLALAGLSSLLSNKSV